MGKLYCGISLDWHYDRGYLDTSMPTYFKKQLSRYKHQKPTRIQNTPLEPAPRTYGADAQRPTPEDNSPLLSEKDKIFVQQVTGSFLYYA